MRKSRIKKLTKKYKQQVLRDIFILSQKDIALIPQHFDLTLFIST